MYFPEDPTSLNQRFGNCDLINWTPDSGASSHFTPVKSDLINPERCYNPVRVADGAICESRWVGSVEAHFFSNQGKSSILRLHRVYYVPDLNKRLLSLTTLSATPNYNVHIRHRATTIDLPDASSFTWPVRLRKWQPSQPHHAFNTESAPLHDTPAQPPKSTMTLKKVPSSNTVQSPEKSLSLELISQRMAHKNIKTLLTGSLHKVWHNVRLAPTTSTDNWPLRISVSHKHSRSKLPQRTATEPFHTLHLDLIHNPFRYSITESTNYEYYLFIVATPGRYCGWLGLTSNHSSTIFDALQKWLTDTSLLGRVNDVRFIRTDAGTNFMSEEFVTKCVSLGIKVESAAPRHQEMNGICEAKWRQVHNTANIMLNTARLGGAFFHHAHSYAVDVINTLPARNVVDEHGLPSTPYYVCFKRKPKITNFRTFGCPVYFKVVNPQKGRGIITKQQQLQRACRGIFVGFPKNSAGWLVYSVQLPTRLAISNDVYFDESFESALAFDSKPFAAAVPIRSALDPAALTTNISNEAAKRMPRTGNVADLGLHLSKFDPIDRDNQHYLKEGRTSITNTSPTTTTSVDPNLQQHLTSRKAAASKYGINYYVEDPASDVELDASSGNKNVQTSSHPLGTQNKDQTSTRNTTSIDEMMLAIDDDYDECGDWSPSSDPLQSAFSVIDTMVSSTTKSADQHATIKPELEPVDKYLPEPQTLQAVLRLDPDIKKAWLHSIYVEIKNLIDNNTFILGETMRKDELLIRTKIVNKAKQSASGLLEKLKSRIVARGDMLKRRMKSRARAHQEAKLRQKMQNLEAQRMGHTPQIVDIPEPYEDTWSPCASSRGVKMLLADICKARRTIKSADFIGAYLQAKIVGRHFRNASTRTSRAISHSMLSISAFL